MPVYKDEKRNTWFCKCNYKDWLGKSKSKMKRGFATKKDAQQWERDFLQKQSASMDMKFASFVDVYFEDKAPRLKERSIMTKRTLFETKIIPYFGEKQMNEITAVDIIKWQNALLNQDYKPTYLRMIQNQMTALFNHAEKFYDLKDNPCKKVDKMGRPNAKELNFWTKDEYEVFLETDPVTFPPAASIILVSSARFFTIFNFPVMQIVFPFKFSLLLLLLSI